MASLSSVSTPRLNAPRMRPAAEPISWAALVDSAGVVQDLDGSWPASIAVGSRYDRFLAGVCGENPERAVAIGAGIRAVAAGREDTFSLEFPCSLAGCDVRLRLAAAPYCEGAARGVLLTHAHVTGPQDSPALESDPQAHKMEALGRLTGGVVHDFANLLTLIAGYSGMLLDRMGPLDTLRPELEEIQEAAARGAGMTAQILDYIRREAEQPGAVSLNSLAAEMEKLLRPIIGEHITVSTALSPDLGDVTADPAQLTRVLMNLVLNARDAMPRGGRITIATANVELPPDPARELPPGPYVLLTVSDTGQGMDAETAEHLFQPFFTTKRPGEGTGLGLSTVYSIVKQSGGDIRVRSEPGKGTTFSICLPRAGEPGGPSERPASPRAAGAGTETILLAEDEDSVRRLIKHLLTARGYTVLDAPDGGEAARIFERHTGPIHLLLTDMIMPGMGGPELAQKLLECRPDLKVIYMSGYTDDMLLRTGALGPGISFLRKPVKSDVLAGRIREVLDGPAHK
jgi:two-component system cell cycle sensor histidine kinase/response regulator CckA